LLTAGCGLRAAGCGLRWMLKSSERIWLIRSELFYWRGKFNVSSTQYRFTHRRESAATPTGI
jgi:hypothetical protein